ncbi:hypothetical protein ABG768_025646, partial [Culter alburnus]
VDSSVETVMGIEEMTEGVLKLDEVFRLLLPTLLRFKKQLTRKEQKAKKVKLTVGDKVWRCNVQSQQRKGGKLDQNFLGPYTIKNIEGKNADLIDERGAILPKINIDHLRLYTEQKPRIPHKIVARRSTAATASQKTCQTATSPVIVAASLPSSPTFSKAATSPDSAAESVTSSPTTTTTAVQQNLVSSKS